jgi:fermentation-respiration switch protein FrsA (DUF1100 family)
MEKPMANRWKTAAGGTVLALALFAIALSTSSCLSTYFYNFAIARNDKHFLENSKYLKSVLFAKILSAGRKWFEDQPYETVSIVSGDGLKLVGYYLPAETATTKTAILAHGYYSCGLEMGAFAEFCHKKLGYNVLMPDARGAGASEGNYIGLGWPDRLDYLQWISWVIARVGSDARICLMGVSMGGATVLMTSGENLPSNVKVIVEDCGYTSVADEVTYLLKTIFHQDPEPIIPETSKLTKIKAGYNFEEASALDQVRKSKTPILFIHGDADTFVPFEMAQRLYDACSAEKELFVVHGAGHGESFIKDPKGYLDHVTAFVGKYIDDPKSRDPDSKPSENIVAKVSKAAQ